MEFQVIEIDIKRRVIRLGTADGGYYEWHDGDDGHEMKYSKTSPVGFTIQSITKAIQNEIGILEGRYILS